ncbi:MAG: hypothetical protein ACK4R7_04240 [Fervidobacterium sp.]
MSNEQRSRNMSKIIKVFAHEFSYNPGPIMEEKIVRKIKRQKTKRILYKLGVVCVFFVIFLLGSEKIVLEKDIIGNTFSLQWLAGKNNQTSHLNSDFNNTGDKQSNNFKLIFNTNIAKNIFVFSDEINFEKKDFQMLIGNEELVLEKEKQEKQENVSEDNLFKMLKYVSIANDGDW